MGTGCEECAMSKFDTNKWQWVLIEEQFQLLKKNAELTGKQMNDMVIEKLNLHLNQNEERNIRYRMNWERRLLADLGFFEHGVSKYIWKIGPGGEYTDTINGNDLIQARMALYR